MYKKEETIQLSQEQEFFIEKALEGHNILVDACIGSGKTTAIQHLCNHMKDRKILYLTYNKLLKVDAQEKIKNKNVTPTNYHGYAYAALASRGIKVAPSQLLDVFLEVRPKFGSYDVMILDEYQDIDTSISKLLEIVKDYNPDIQIIAVGDMKQKIYNFTSLDADYFIKQFLGKNHEELSFTKCFRLSKEFAAELGNAWEKKIIGVNKDHSVQICQNIEIMIQYIATKDPKDILCLGNRNGKMASVLNELERRYPDKFNKSTVYASITDKSGIGSVNPTSDTAIFTTFDSSKGLERKYCFIFDYNMNNWNYRSTRPNADTEILRNIFLVAASRGKKESVFFYAGEYDEPIDFEELKKESKKSVNYFERPFEMSDMFNFKFREDVEECYKSLDITSITCPNDKTDHIDVKYNDEMIDLSPCIATFTEACFFKNYDIDSQLSYQNLVKKQDFKFADDASLEEKILVLTSIEIGQNRYKDQVSIPFITDTQTNDIQNRLGELFDGKEIVEQNCEMSFITSSGNRMGFIGRYNVLKNNEIYDLKFVSELSHEDFLELAAYLLATGCETGYLWNIYDNRRFKVQIQNRNDFANKVAQCVTTGEIRRVKLQNSADVISSFEKGKYNKTDESKSEKKTSKKTAAKKKKTSFDISVVVVGTPVGHKTFGNGIVSDNDGKYIVVYFPKIGEKKFNAKSFENGFIWTL